MQVQFYIFWSFETPTFKSHAKFRKLKSEKRKHCNVKLSVFGRVTLCFWKFWKQEVNNLFLKAFVLKFSHRLFWQKQPKWNYLPNETRYHRFSKRNKFTFYIMVTWPILWRSTTPKWSKISCRLYCKYWSA